MKSYFARKEAAKRSLLDGGEKERGKIDGGRMEREEESTVLVLVPHLVLDLKHAKRLDSHGRLSLFPLSHPALNLFSFLWQP